jgi:hypothetical protein
MGERIRGASMAVVDDREGVGVLLVDEGHQVLVREALE